MKHYMFSYIVCSTLPLRTRKTINGIGFHFFGSKITVNLQWCKVVY